MNVREKLTELLKSVLPNFRNNMAYWGEKPIYEFADCLLANGVTMPQWISVKDRLPEDYKQRVMVFCNGDYPIGYPKIDTDRYARGHWVRYGIYVTHWMPLPEPPKGE